MSGQQEETQPSVSGDIEEEIQGEQPAESEADGSTEEGQPEDAVTLQNMQEAETGDSAKPEASVEATAETDTGLTDQPSKEPDTEPMAGPDATEPETEPTSEPEAEPTVEAVQETAVEQSDDVLTVEADSALAAETDVEAGLEGEDQAEETVDAPVEYPAQDFVGHVMGVKVTVAAGEGAFPAGTTMKVRAVRDRETLADAADAVADDFVEVTRVHAVDITFYDVDGNEIEPALPISVVMSVAEIGEEQEATVVHVDDEGNAQVVEQSEASTSADGQLELNVEMPAADVEQTAVAAEQTQVAFDADAFSVYVVVITQTIETRYIDANGDTYAIEVGYGEEANIPAGAELSVRELSGEEGEAYIATAAGNLSSGPVAYAKALDISIIANGEEVHPAAPVSVSIRLLDAPEADEDTNIEVVHFGEVPRTVSCALEGDAVVFETDGFSVYVVAYTVDFHWGDYTYSIAGESEIRLSELFEKLGVNEITLADVRDVSFSDESLVRVDALEGDWRLTSLAPFTTHEVLTLSLVNGERVSIEVTDETTAQPVAAVNLVYNGEAQALVTVDESISNAYVFSMSEDGDYNGTIPTGIDAREYTVYYKSANAEQGAQPESLNVTITQKQITVSGIAAEDKTYDGTTVATLDYTNAVIGGKLNQDDLTVSATGTFDNANAGENKTVTLSDWALGGASAANYVLAEEGRQTVTTANITPLNVTVTIVGANNTAVYDGQEHTVTGYTATADTELFDVDQNVTFSGTDEAKRTNVREEGDDDNITNMGLEAVQFRKSDEASANFGTVTFNVTDGYQTITPMPVTLTAKSASKQIIREEGQDPQSQSVSGYICTTTAADGHSITLYDTEDEGEPRLTFVGVSASGTGADVGMYPVNFTGVTVKTEDEQGTKDTTGNYEVIEAISGMLIITDGQNQAIEKEMTGFEGNLATYQITVNPNAEVLNPNAEEPNKKQKLTLKDTFSSNQSIIYSSIKIQVEDSDDTDGEVTYDYSGYTGTFTIPDETSVTITYTTRVKGEADQTVRFDNTARLGKYIDGSGFVGCASTVNEEQIVTPTGTDIEGSGGVYTIELYVYPDGQMETGLNGAEFRLLDSNRRPIQVNGNDVLFETGAKGAEVGYQTITLTGEQAIRKNTVYYLEMTKAPYTCTVTQDDQTGDDVYHYTYYQKDNTLYNFLITDTPGYAQAGIYSYYNGDTLKVRCYPESGGVNVTKRFSGNYSLTKAQQNSIRFVLQKDVTETEEAWADVEEHDYGDFNYGSMNFNTGSSSGDPLEPSAHYRVIEEGADPQTLGLDTGIELNTTYSISYQSKGEQIQEQANDFTVFGDDIAFSYSIVVDNEYVDHRLTLGILDEEKGRMLPGGVFTVFDERGTAVTTYTTGENGMVDIHRGDEGASYTEDTLYYAVQTKAPASYLLPDAPEKVYFYFSGESAQEFANATDLTKSYNTVTVSNHANQVRVPVTVTWGLNESSTWPVGVDHIELKLVQSTDGGQTYSPVEKGGGDWIIRLTPVKFFDNSTFVNLPAQVMETDPEDPEKTIMKDIAYSIEEKAVYSGANDTEDITAQYASSCRVSGTGWYVVKHQPAVSVVVEKKWFELDGTTQVTNNYALAQKPEVKVDLYRATAEPTGSISSRDELLAFLANAEPERTGIALNAGNDFKQTVTSLPATYLAASGEQTEELQYYYYALEREEGEGRRPDNHVDTYEVTDASESALRALVINNTQTPTTINVNAVDLDKTYGQTDPAFAFKVKVQNAGTTISKVPDSVEGDRHSDVTEPDDAGYYTVTGKNADNRYDFAVSENGGESKVIVFDCSREDGEDVGSYTITSFGDESQQGYLVIYKGAKLTVSQKQIIVKADGTKEYSTKVEKQGNDWVSTDGPADWVSFYHEEPAEEGEGTRLVKYDNTLENGDAFTVITFAAEREPGEDAGEYEVTLSGEADQGNYLVTFAEGGKFTITPANVTVTPDVPDPATETNIKVYGEDDPELKATVSGLKFDDSDDVIDYDLTRAEGEIVGDYTVTSAGAVTQGNYTVTFETGTFKITPAAVTVTVEDADKVYGAVDPEWSVEIDGLKGVDGSGELSHTAGEGGALNYTYTVGTGEAAKTLLSFTVTRTAGEDVGEYAVTPSGDETQGNYTVAYSDGKLTIERAELIVKADDTAKIWNTDDPSLTETLTGLAERDSLESDTGLVRTIAAGTGDNEGKFVVTYTRKGAAEPTEPELTFILARAEGVNPGEYTIAVTGAETQKNYIVEYEEGVFTILEVHDVLVFQETVDPTDETSNPRYTYDWTAVIENIYHDSGSFTLPVTQGEPDNPNAYTLQKIPHGATLTVTQQADAILDVDYETTLAIDKTPYSTKTHNQIQLVVDDYYELTFTHSRNCLPVYAMTEPEESAQENPKPVTGSRGFAAIPDDVMVVSEFEATYRTGYTLPTDRYYVYDKAALYTSEGAPIEEAGNVTGIRFDAQNNKWQYTTDNLSGPEANPVFHDVPAGAQLVLFYMPKYTCKIDNVKFYTLEQAMAYIAQQESHVAVIEMLIANYTMRASDAVTIPADEEYDVTLKTAVGEYEGGTEHPVAAITRDSAFTGDMFTVYGKFTLENIIIDGAEVNTSGVMVSVKHAKNATEEPYFTLSAHATLQNAKGNNGAAMWVESGTVTVDAYAELTGNAAVNGAAMYIRGGTVTVDADAELTGNSARENGGAVYIDGGMLNLNSAHVTGNSANHGGALYVVNYNNNIKPSVTIGGAIGGANEGEANTATDGGAVYVQSGTLTVKGTILGNTASGNGGGNGGGLCVNGGIVTLENDSTIGGAEAGSGNSAANGGGVYKAAGTLNLEGAITGNTASNNGGGLFTVNDQTVGGSVTNNTASVNGGGIYAGGGTLTATAAITGNTATTGNGGGVYQASGTYNLNGGSVSNNTAIAGNGGGICALNVTTTVSGAVLAGNAASQGNGGALYMEGGSVMVQGGPLSRVEDTETVNAVARSLIGGTEEGSGNTANAGGAIYASSGSVTIANGDIIGNSATASGGAIYAQSASVTVKKQTTTIAVVGSDGKTSNKTVEVAGADIAITGNTASQGNGGAICSASGAVTISDGTLSDNAANNSAGNETDGLGGAVYAGSGNVTYSGDSITGNTATNGAALYVGSGVADISASITGNIPGENGGAVGVGSTSARLQFSGNANVYDNKLGNDQRNVCLNVDSESVIVATGMNSGKKIGVYVPGSVTDPLVIKRGDICGYFGSYTNADNLGTANNPDSQVFKNDQFGELESWYENNRLYWRAKVTYYFVYKRDFSNTEPPKAGASYSNTSNETLYLKVVSDNPYYPRSSENSIYDLVTAMDLYNKHKSDFEKRTTKEKAASAVFAYAYGNNKNGTFDTGLQFSDFLTNVNWDRVNRKWVYLRRDGTEVTNVNRIVVI